MPSPDGTERRKNADIEMVLFEVKLLRENTETHISGIKEDISEIKTGIKGFNGVTTDVSWLKKIMFVIIPCLLGAIVSLIFIFIKINGGH